MRAANRPRGATAIRAEQSPLATIRLPQLNLKRGHLMAGVAIVGCIAIAFGLTSNENTQPEPQPVLEEELFAPVAESSAPAEPIDTFTVEAQTPKEQLWNEQVVRSGDNLSLIFKRAGFDTRDVHRVVSESPDGKGLARIYPGQTIAFRGNQAGELMSVRHVKSELETISYSLEDGGFTSEVLTRTPETRQSNATGVITSSLFLAGQKAGLSHTTIMGMANIFGGVIDFVGDPRKGDTMHLLFEELYIDGSKFDDGEIIAASYTNQGKTFTAYRYTDSNGDTGYFNADGVSMRKAFLLAPVDFTRISSNFNPRRIHPIYKTARPHRGTDYAASTGTPVYAAGDGRVIKAGYSKSNGNYIFIQHGEQFVTKYLHLHKRKVKQGARVSQSQIIGTVGSTGAATGPHLHYEFLMNGVHRNPRTIHKKLPKAKSLAASEMPRFRQAISDVSAQLAALQQDSDTRLAMTKSGEDKG
ncbi:MAG: peptidoglycan DD-metalloendopeptidase family protein [Halioglobus sp.]